MNPIRDDGRRAVLLWLGAATAVLLFLFAVRLLGTATGALSPLLDRLLRRLADGDAAALGLGWLAAYVLANGSVVAALAVSLFDAGLLTRSQLFVTVAGSRLGGAAVVVFVGGVDYLQKRSRSLGRSLSLGMLSFLLTHSVYLPATALGYLLLGTAVDDRVGALSLVLPGGRPLGVFEAATTAIVASVGAAPGFLLAVLALFAGLRLFDRVLSRADTEWLRQTFFSRLQRTWTSFLVGLVLTALTTSVAFSLGVVVPLYNRDYVTREEMLPYVLGANVGTLFDTLVVAVVLDSPEGVGVVLFLLGLSLVVTLAALLAVGPYGDGVERVHDRLIADRRSLLAALLVLLLAPLALLVLPQLV
ncbi:MAG: sodium:phosphate symporter [Haloarculaceae archaeon]